MKKTLLAAALAVGFAGAAQAQTSVTLYGVVDGGLGYTQYKRSGAKAQKFGLEDGVQAGNRWGLKGVEDLGGGLKALFVLESGFNLVDGKSAQGGRLFGRAAYLGLASDSWGQVAIGRQTNIASQFLGGILSPFGDAFKHAAIGQSFSSAATVRADNVISYVTPNFSGFQFGIGYSFNANGSQGFDVKKAKDNPDDKNAKLLTTGLRYVSGPLALGVSYDDLDIETNKKNIRAWNLAGSYDFEVVKLHLGFGQEREGLFTSLGADFGDLGKVGVGGLGTQVAGFKSNNYSVGLSAPVGGGSLMVGWQSKRLSSGAFKDAAEKRSQNLYSLGYTYALSKRTNVYAVGTYGQGYAFTDTKVTQAVVGLRHQF